MDRSPYGIYHPDVYIRRAGEGSTVESRYRSRRAEVADLCVQMRAAGATTAEVAAVVRDRYRVSSRVAFRYASGMTQQQVADTWNALFAEDDGNCVLTHKNISYWEAWPASTGRPPSAQTLNQLARIYRCRAEDLLDGEDHSESSGYEQVPASGAFAGRPEVVIPTKRRTLLAASFAAPIAAAVQRPEKTGHVTFADAQRVRRLLPELYSLDDAHGGGMVAATAQWCLRRVDDLLNRADYGQGAGVELRVAHGELAEMSGWLAFDCGRLDEAEHLYGSALRSAQLANDLELEVLVLASMIMVARHRDRPREALQVAHLAQRRSTGWATPKLLSLLASREGIALAQMGDERGARAAIQRAFNIFEAPTQQEDPAWLSFFQRSELIAAQAAVATYLGKLDQAASLFQDVLGTLDASYVRNRALYLGQLAATQLKLGDETEACKTLDQSLAHFAKVRSGRASTHFNTCMKRIEASKTPQARNLAERVRHLQLQKTTP